MGKQNQTTLPTTSNYSLSDYQYNGMESFATKVNTFIEQDDRFKTKNLKDGKGKGGSVKAFCRFLAKFTGDESDKKLIDTLSQGFNTYLKEVSSVPIGRLMATAEFMGCSTDYLLGLTNVSKHTPLETAALSLGFNLSAAQHLANQRLASSFPKEKINVTEGKDGKEYWQYVFTNESGDASRTYEELNENAKAAGLKAFSPQPPERPLPFDYLDILNLIFAPLDENEGRHESIADMLVHYISACAIREQDRLLHRLEWTGPEPNERLLDLQQKLEHVATRYAKEQSKKTNEIKEALDKGLPTEEDYLNSLLDNSSSPEEQRRQRLVLEAYRNNTNITDETIGNSSLSEFAKEWEENHRDKSEFEKRTGIDHPEKLPAEKRYQAYPAKHPRSEVPLDRFDNKGNVLNEETAHLYALLKKEGLNPDEFWSGAYDIPSNPEYTPEALHDRISTLQTLLDALEQERELIDRGSEEIAEINYQLEREQEIKSIMESRGIDYNEAAQRYDELEKAIWESEAEDTEINTDNWTQVDYDLYNQVDDDSYCSESFNDPESYSSEMYEEYSKKYMQSLSDNNSGSSPKKQKKSK